MPPLDPPPTRHAMRAAVMVIGVIAILIMVIFVGRTLYHADTQQEQAAGQRDPHEQPRGPNDLQSEPVREGQ